MSWRISDVLQTSKGVTADRYFIVTSDTVIEMLFLEYKCTIQAKHRYICIIGKKYFEIIEEFDVFIFQQLILDN